MFSRHPFDATPPPLHSQVVQLHESVGNRSKKCGVLVVAVRIVQDITACHAAARSLQVVCNGDVCAPPNQRPCAHACAVPDPCLTDPTIFPPQAAYRGRRARQAYIKVRRGVAPLCVIINLPTVCGV